MEPMIHDCHVSDDCAILTRFTLCTAGKYRLPTDWRFSNESCKYTNFSKWRQQYSTGEVVEFDSSQLQWHARDWLCKFFVNNYAAK